MTRRAVESVDALARALGRVAAETERARRLMRAVPSSVVDADSVRNAECELDGVILYVERADRHRHAWAEAARSPQAQQRQGFTGRDKKVTPRQKKSSDGLNPQ